MSPILPFPFSCSEACVEVFHSLRLRLEFTST